MEEEEEEVVVEVVHDRVGKGPETEAKDRVTDCRTDSDINGLRIILVL